MPLLYLRNKSFASFMALFYLLFIGLHSLPLQAAPQDSTFKSPLSSLNSKENSRPLSQINIQGSQTLEIEDQKFLEEMGVTSEDSFFKANSNEKSPEIVEKITEKVNPALAAGGQILGSPLGNSRKMGVFEKVAWTIGKALIPTLTVIGAAAFLGPLLPIWGVVAATVVLGAVVGGGLNYLSDLRANSFLEEGKKKQGQIIIRDALMAGVKEGVMAPFNMVVPGLFKPVGNLGARLIATTALKGAAVSFSGQLMGNVAQGLTKNWFNNRFMDYDKRRGNIDHLLEEYSTKLRWSEEDKKNVEYLLKERDAIDNDSYTLESFSRETKKAAITSALSGFLGGSVSRLTANTDIAGRASMALFKDVKHTAAIANLVVNLPFSYAGGYAGSEMDKKFIKEDISKNEAMLRASKPGTPFADYYQTKILSLNKKLADTNSNRIALNSMVSSLAVNSAMVGFDVAKTRLFDLPKQQRLAIEKKYQAQNPEWVKANTVKGELDKLAQPQRKDFPDDSTFQSATQDYKIKYSNLSANYKSLASSAKATDSTTTNVLLKKEAASQFMAGEKNRQTLELAEFMGEDDYLEATVKMMKKQGKEGTNQELHQQARIDLMESYKKNLEKTTETLGKLDSTLSEGGKKAMVISPTAYKEAFIKKEIAQLRAIGASDGKVHSSMSRILNQAEHETLSKYGNSWGQMAQAELTANALKKAGFNDQGEAGGKTKMWAELKNAPKAYQEKFIHHYRDSFSNQLKDWALVPLKQKSKEEREKEKSWWRKMIEKFTPEGKNSGTGN